MTQQGGDAPVKVGDVLADKYRVDRVLGVGGMGVVVAATHLDLGERRALKFMLPELRSNANVTERFMREARAAARLKSEHVVKIHDVGRFETGEPFLVMEYLEGEDLKAMLECVGAMPAHQVVAYALQALEAIAEAHAAGIIHRDLKPANLFIAKDAEGLPSLKVLDFGISKLSDDKGERKDLTRTASVIGSPIYMSPEQMRSTKSVDARTDIWAFGVILYELLVGREPFQGESITALCSQVLQNDPQPPSQLGANVPEGLEQAVLRCLAKDRSQRFQNAAELAEAIAPYATGDIERSLRRIRRFLAAAPPPAVGAVSAPPHVGPLAAAMPAAGESGSVAIAAAPPAHAATVAARPAQTGPEPMVGPIVGRRTPIAAVVAAISAVVLILAAAAFVLVGRKGAETAAGAAAASSNAPPTSEAQPGVSAAPERSPTAAAPVEHAESSAAPQADAGEAMAAPSATAGSGTTGGRGSGAATKTPRVPSTVQHSGDAFGQGRK